MKRDQSVYLQHILDAIDRIDEYLEGVDEEAFHQRYFSHSRRRDSTTRNHWGSRKALKSLPEERRQAMGMVVVASCWLLSNLP